MQTVEQIVQIKPKRTKIQNTVDKKNVLRKIQHQFKEEWETTGGLSAPSKMPGFGYSIPANSCITGSKLALIEGSACFNCYAMKGNYLYPSVNNALHKRLYALADLMWVPAMATLIDAACSAVGEQYFRWHDAGDLQGEWHLKLIIEVAKLTPHIKHWLPTREIKFLRKISPQDIPANLIIRVSANLIDGKPPQVGFNTSTITSNNTAVLGTSAVCGAYTRDGYCGECRVCWSASAPDVSYPKH